MLHRPQQIEELIGHHLHRPGNLPLRNLARNLSAHRPHFTLEVPNTCLAGISLAKHAKRFFRQFEFDFIDAVLFDLARDQEALRNLDLLFERVAREFDHFHAVAQRRRDRVDYVCRGDEQHTREIERNFEIVIAELAVLFRVEHFEQRR